MTKLTLQQKIVLMFLIQSYRIKYPSIMDIARHFGWTKQNAQYYVSQLRKKGYIDGENKPLKSLPLDKESN